MSIAPRVSVVMPTYNRAHLIEASIRSVLGQSFGDLELIVVDDGSTDETESVIAGFGDPRIVYVKNEGRKGVSGARNFAIAQARADLIGFLDSDDEWKSRKLELQVPMLDADPLVDVVGCGWRWLSKETGQVRKVRVPGEDGRIDEVPRWVYNTCPDLLIRRPLLLSTPFDEDLTTYECLDWVLRLSMAGTFRFVPTVLVDCCDHAGPRASDGEMRSLEALERVVSRYEGFIRQDAKAWAGMTLRIGSGLLVAGANRKRARRYLIRSLWARPTRIRTWKFSAASFVPWGVSIRSRLRRLGSRTSRIRER